MTQRYLTAAAILLTAALLLPLPIATASSYCSADLNGDGFVDAQDTLIFMQQWHTEGVVPPKADPARKITTQIESVTIPEDNRPEVVLTLTNELGEPLPPAKLSRFSFTIAKLVVDNPLTGRSRYQNYITRTVQGPYGPAVQPTYDSGGTVTDLGNGRYQYKFGRTLANVERNLTHTLACQFEYTVDGKRSIANPIFNFVPDGSPVVMTRETSSTETCNKCHNPLAEHGGGRRDYTLCLVCHYPGVIDPDTGNSVDMAVMTHKIHRGAHLPSVVSGTPYIIIGFQGAVHDYSHIHFPQDIRNCGACHTGKHADWHKTHPSRAACGSCHDDVNFVTGAGHGPGIPQANDNACSTCHPSTMANEFDTSVPGAHVIPSRSRAVPKLTAEILEVSNVAVDASISIRFRITQEINGATSTVAPGSLNRVAVTMAGPTTDYSFFVTEVITNANSTDNGDGTRTYQLRRHLPAGTTGTYAFGLEARTNTQTVNGVAVRDGAANPVVFAAVTGPLQPRRDVVDWDKCLACHGDEIVLHGDQRISYHYCVMCHNPVTTDIARRPADKMPPETIDFKVMVHKIHAGVHLSKDYTVYGFGNIPHNYNDIHYPGDLADCQACHLPGTYLPPPPRGAIDTVVQQGNTEISRLGPTSAACTGCHDTDAAMAHVQSNLAAPSGKESCAVCHAQFRSSSVEAAHARD